MDDFIRRNACKSHDFAVLKPFPRPRRSNAAEVRSERTLSRHHALANAQVRSERHFRLRGLAHGIELITHQ